MKISVSSNPIVGRLSVSTGPIGPQGAQGAIGAQGPAGAAASAGDFVGIQGSTMYGPLIIEYEGEGLLVNADAQIIEDLTVGEVLRVGDFEITSNNFTTTNNGEIVIDSFPPNLYSTVKYIVQVSNVTGIHATEILCMQNGLSIYATEYATLLSNSQLGSFSVQLSGGLSKLLFNINNPSLNITNIHVLRHGLRF